MPHEHIYSLDADPKTPNRAQVAWGPPSSPSNTGPGHGNGEGHVMVVVERPGTPARLAASVEHTREKLAALVDTVRTRAGEDGLLDFLMDAWGSDLVYAWGGQCELLAVTIDRQGCNKMIRALRKGRDAAFGRDE